MAGHMKIDAARAAKEITFAYYSPCLVDQVFRGSENPFSNKLCLPAMASLCLAGPAVENPRRACVRRGRKAVDLPASPMY